MSARPAAAAAPPRAPGCRPRPARKRRGAAALRGARLVAPWSRGVRAGAASARARASFEYLGERVSHARPTSATITRHRTTITRSCSSSIEHTVIDAGVNGNEARFINHACEPNCESVIEGSRVFIDALRDHRPGEELTYDYQIRRERNDPPDIDAIFACRCGVGALPRHDAVAAETPAIEAPAQVMA